ncbi:hypothetical protein TM7_0160 [candidate division TM7 genomosp. GTL1]|nr:hypothetical protein TM7_0160 [candidate division TM7 genomosp. GTL1]
MLALASAGYDVVGIDYADKLLKIARGKSNLSNVVFLQQDVAHLKLGQTFDAAICMWSTFGELPYKEMLGKLKPTGGRPTGLHRIMSTLTSRN